jgi:hypothetical protein
MTLKETASREFHREIFLSLPETGDRKTSRGSHFAIASRNATNSCGEAPGFLCGKNNLAAIRMRAMMSALLRK